MSARLWDRSRRTGTSRDRRAESLMYRPGPDSPISSGSQPWLVTRKLGLCVQERKQSRPAHTQICTGVVPVFAD